ncbi:enoyl-CoA hydratase-related protein [Homoserinimonas sp. A447]
MPPIIHVDPFRVMIVSDFGSLPVASVQRVPMLQQLTDENRQCDQMRDFAALPVVKIAMIEGYCFGAGASLASTCDVRCAVENATFRMPGLDVRLAIGSAAMARLGSA